MKQPVVLRVYKGENLEVVRQFEHTQIVIGRNNDVQLQLQDDSVALLHAMIEDRGGEYYISDLGSESGTYKNGNRLLEGKLNSGDQLIIGGYRIQFFIGIPKPVAPPSITASQPVGGGAPQVPASVSFTLPETTGFIAVPPAAEPALGKKTTPTAILDPNDRTDKIETKKTSTGGAAKAVGKKKTFAPPNPYKDLRDIVKPGKGSLIEVLVVWNNKVLSSNHFRNGRVTISSHPDADVVVPIVSSRSRYELIKISGQATICLTQEMTGEVIRDNGEVVNFAELSRQNKIRKTATHFELDVRQGEMVRVGLQNDLISLYIRYIPDTTKPLVAPLLDMTSSEVTGIILAMAVSMIMGLYMNIYTPTPLLEDEARQEEPIRKVTVKFEPPPKVQEPVKVEEPPKEEKVEKKIVKVEDKKVEQKKEAQQAVKPSVAKAGPSGQAGEVAPNPNVKPVKNKVVSAKPGGAVKTAPKEGANMKSEKPDPTKQGLLGVFASKGMQKQIDKAYSGSGELQGMAESATGFAGNAENRDGDNLGTKLKDAGSGKGSSTVGIAGVGTKGRGTGTTGYGTGGLGQKGSVQINVQGQEGEFTGGMDKEAIRRVIREHLREIRTCYERELQRSPDLQGKIVLQWDIEEGGRVGESKVKSNALGNDSVANCILARLRTWKFPEPPAGQIGRVDYPFLFSSQ